MAGHGAPVCVRDQATNDVNAAFIAAASCGGGSDSRGCADRLASPPPRVVRMATTTTRPTTPATASHQPRWLERAGATDMLAADDSVVPDSARVGAVGPRASRGGGIPWDETFVRTALIAVPSSVPDEN